MRLEMRPIGARSLTWIFGNLGPDYAEFPDRLQKTGCTRQAEVIALFAGISPPRGDVSSESENSAPASSILMRRRSPMLLSLRHVLARTNEPAARSRRSICARRLSQWPPPP